MKHHYWKQIISMLLVLALVLQIAPLAVNAEDQYPENMECDPQTGLTSSYEYETFDAGMAGTAYVNDYMGTLHLRRVDLTLDGERMPVSVEFYYDPVNTGNTYGRGWTTCYNQIVSFDANTGYYGYKNENGTWIYFSNSGKHDDNGNEVWEEVTTYGIGETGSEMLREPNAPASDFTAIDIVVSELHHEFDTAGRLVSVHDTANQITINYVSSTGDQISSIVDPIGRRYSFAYEYGVLRRISCKDASNQAITTNGVALSVTYTMVNGCLHTVTYPGGYNVVSYTYDANNRLTSTAGADGHGYCFAYSTASGTVASVTEKAAIGTAQEECGQITYFSITSAGTTITSDEMQKQYIFDCCGRITNCELRVASQLDEEHDMRDVSRSFECVYGVNVTYGFVEKDDGSIVSSVIDVQAYDANGVISGDEDATEPTESETEATESEDVDQTEPDHYSYTTDEFGNITSETHTEGNLSQTTTYNYSSNGNFLLSKTDEDGNTEYYTYNEGTGLLESLINANGAQTNYSYNAIRELQSVHLDVTGLVNVTGMDAQYSYTHGRLTGLNYGCYNYAFSYDVWGNIVGVSMNGSSLVSYDYGNHPYKKTVHTMTYGNGQQVFYSYNNLGQVDVVGYTNQPNRFHYFYGDDGVLTSISDSITGETIVYTDTGFEIHTADDQTLYSCEANEQGSKTETINGWQMVSTSSRISNNAGTTLLSFSKRFDDFNRQIQKQVRFGTRSVTYSSEYATDSNGNTGNNIVRYAVRYGHNSTESSITYRFTYDSLGNIVEQRMLEETVGGSGAEIMSIPEHGDFPLPGPPGPEPFDNSIATYYTYDEAGQLKKVIDGHTNITYTYSYDESGNVISSTAKKSGRVVHSYSFRYTNGLLTVFSKGNGHTLQYVNDSMGNPVQIIDGTNVKELTWGEGRALTGIFIDDDNYSTYTYNADGLRTSKTVSVHGVEETTRYVWGSNGLAGVITDDHTVVVLYDNDGEAIGFSVDGTVFTYIKNLQGDVIRVLNSDGDVVMTYSYDPWGAPITSIFSHRASSIGIPEPQENLAKYNPCTYRGYYYDQETGYYYLQSRYYDPESGRFLNADETIFLNSDGDDIISNNLFSYCGNSPTQHKDPTGYFYISLSNVKNILCMIGLNPVASVLISIGLYKLKTLVVSKCALLLAKLGAFWGPVIQAAFVFVGTIVCVPTVSDFVVAFWDCVFQGYRGISVGIKYSRWGFPYGFSVYAS